jgi:hypothetical protein
MTSPRGRPLLMIVTSGSEGARTATSWNQFAGQCEPMFRFSLPGPANGGSPSLAIQAAVSSNSDGGGERPPWLWSSNLILLLTDLLAIAFASECFFHSFLLTWFQIKRVTLDFLDNVFGLHLALEASQRILKGFAFLYSNLCQEKYTSKQSQSGYLLEYAPLQGKTHKSMVTCSLDVV